LTQTEQGISLGEHKTISSDVAVQYLKLGSAN